MRRAVALLLFVMAFGHAAVAQNQRADSQFLVLDYNQLTNQYQPVATWLHYSSTKKGEDLMSVEYDAFGIGDYGNDTFFVTFQRSNANEYRALIAKYLSWEEVASKDGDQFSKAIGSADTQQGKLEFAFSSASAERHLLKVHSCSKGLIAACANPGMTLDREGVIELDRALESLAANGFQSLAIDEKYK